MGTFDHALALAHEVRLLAGRAASGLAGDPAARQAARRSKVRPVDYMRYAEFEAMLRGLPVEPGMRMLDVASPQWFSLCLASRFPDIHIVYVNIIERELEAHRRIAEALALGNIEYRLADVRKLDFDGDSFDRVVSISVIEHVAPEVGGDVAALSEIRRVLKPAGRFGITMPLKSKRNIVYVDGDVYERSGQERNFFAREYDKAMFDALIEESRMTVEDLWFIGERQGALAIDFHEWGDGSGSAWSSGFKFLRKLAERGLHLPVEETLAARYLTVSRTVEHRVVNVAAILSKT